MASRPFSEKLCHCVEKHVPKPLEVHEHHVWPLGKGGPDVKDNLLTLCPTTHQNVHMLWRLYDDWAKEGMLPPWAMLRRYSDYVRRVVLSGREQQRRANAAVHASNPDASRTGTQTYNSHSGH